MTKAKPLNERQRDMLRLMPHEWGVLPSGIGRTSATFVSLIRRGLVEMQYVGQPIGWWWRKTPEGVAE